MKTKKISILYIILLLVGVTLLGYTQARAYVLGDGICDTEESKLNLCITAWEYVIEVLPDDDGNWPSLTPDGTQKAYTYMATAPANCDSPTWSYSVTQLAYCEGSTEVDYVTGSDPTGSALFIPQGKVSKCSDLPTEEGVELWKLNPTLSCSDVKTSLTYTVYSSLESGLSCGNWTVVRTKDGCEGGYLRGPGCDNPGPIETTRVFDNGQLTVNFDICTGEPSNVTFSGAETATTKAWICVDGNPQNGGIVDDCEIVTNAGPRSSGCYIFGSRTYLYGGDARTAR